MAFDPHRKFVHVTELRDDGFVAFDFAIGEPELFVEMIMPSAVFDDFCAMNRVSFLDERACLKVGPEEWNWRLNDATQRRFKS